MLSELHGDDGIRTARLVLVPVAADDADELTMIFADERLYVFTGGAPDTMESLRDTLGRLAEERAAGTAAQFNWVVRRLVDGMAVGMLQAVLRRGGRAAEISWLVGVPWQGQGFASEAAIAVVSWLEARSVEQIIAWIRPDHHASESVAIRAGLVVTDKTRTTHKHEHIERLWRDQRASGTAAGRSGSR
jgi:RimJ/RimL family protein N-acetyltransferase